MFEGRRFLPSGAYIKDAQSLHFAVLPPDVVLWRFSLRGLCRRQILTILV